MPAERIVIVGGGAGGLATARSYREHGGQGSVTLVGAEPALPYRRPPLSKEFLRGELDADALRIERESWFHDHDVQLRLGTAVKAIDPEHGTVTVSGAERLPADALEHRAVAGRTLAGDDARWESVPGFWSTIGTRTLKYAAWGDGYDEARISAQSDEAFTVWYTRGGRTVGVLTHERDTDYERGRELITQREPAP